MAVISKLVVALQANSAKLVTELKKSRSTMAKFVKDVKKKASSMKKSFKPVISVVKALTKAFLAGTAVVTGFFAGLSIRAHTINQLKVLSESLGVSVEQLQRWQFAAKAVGIESDKMGDIFKDVADKLGDFLVTGGGQAADLFEKLNLDARKFIGLAPDQALLKIGRAIEPLTQQEKIFFMEAIANDAALLLPLLENNAKGFNELAAEAEKAGAVLSKGQVEGAAKFSKVVDELLARANSFWSQFTAQLAGPLAVFSEHVKKWIDSFGGIDKAAKRAAHFVLTFIESGIKGGAKFVRAISNIDITFAKLELRFQKWLLIKDEISRFDPTAIAARSFSGADIDKQLEKRRKAVEELEKRVQGFKNNPRPDTFDQDASALIDKMRKAIDSPFDINTSAQKDNSSATRGQTGATQANTSALQKQRAALERFEKNQAEKNNPKNQLGKLGSGNTGQVNTDFIFRKAGADNLKSSQLFEQTARKFADSIKSQAISPEGAAVSIENLRSLVARLQLDNIRYGGQNFDTEGMKSVIDQLTDLAKDQLSGDSKQPTVSDYRAMFERAAQENKTAQESAANTVAEAIRKASQNEIQATKSLVDQVGPKGNRLGTVKFDFNHDGKREVLEVLATPEAVRKIETIAKRTTQTSARAAVR